MTSGMPSTWREGSKHEAAMLSGCVWLTVPPNDLEQTCRGHLPPGGSLRCPSMPEGNWRALFPGQVKRLVGQCVRDARGKDALN